MTILGNADLILRKTFLLPAFNMTHKKFERIENFQQKENSITI